MELTAEQVCLVVKSHNPMEHMRMGLLENTLASARAAFPSARRLLLANGCDDDSEEAQADLAAGYDFAFCRPEASGGTTPGHGAILAGNLATAIYKLVVFSDDDMLWHEGAEETLVKLWRAAPSELIIVSGLLEPVWPWNTPRETVTHGLVNVLLRDSVPGAAWSFRASDWVVLRHGIVPDFGYDSKLCAALVEESFRIGAIDLAEHAGWGASTHDNNAIDDVPSKPLDRAHWRV